MKTWNVNGEDLTAKDMAKIRGCQPQSIYPLMHRLARQYPNKTDDQIAYHALYHKAKGKRPGFYNGWTAEQQAYYLEITATSFRWRVRQYGLNDPRTWESREQTQKRRIEKQRASMVKYHKRNNLKKVSVKCVPKKTSTDRKEMMATRHIPVGTWESSL